MAEHLPLLRSLFPRPRPYDAKFTRKSVRVAALSTRRVPSEVGVDYGAAERHSSILPLPAGRFRAVSPDGRYSFAIHGGAFRDTNRSMASIEIIVELSSKSVLAESDRKLLAEIAIDEKDNLHRDYAAWRSNTTAAFTSATVSL